MKSDYLHVKKEGDTVKTIAKIMMALLMLNISAINNIAMSENEIEIGTVYSLEPTKDVVDDFFIMLNNMPDIDRALLNDKNSCYSIRTKAEVGNMPALEDLNIWIFKDSYTGATHIVYDDKVVQLIGYSGGIGVTSLALGDLNDDGWNEVYFAYSWNPDTYCSQVGYFDTKTGNVYYFGDYLCNKSELLFTMENGNLNIRKGTLTKCEDKVHYKIQEENNLAEIVFKNDRIEVEPISDDFIKLEEKLEPTKKKLPDWIPQNAEEATEFMKEYNKPIIKDGIICYVKCILGIDSFKGNKICASDNSDIKIPISYKKYKDEYRDEYLVVCFEMLPNSYIDIYDEYDKNSMKYVYISDENNDIIESCKGDINKDGIADEFDLRELQEWILGENKNLVCWQNADVCEDSVIDMFDMVQLRKLLIGQK